MGVPRFFKWLSERYPCAIAPVNETTIPTVDNLYLDMNGIIHNCTHNNEGVKRLLTQKELVLRVFQYIDQLFNLIQPRQYFFMAIDGVAPRAKMNQQRQRRFRSAMEADRARQAMIKNGEIVPDDKEIFDSNAITPGTEFMAELSRHFQYMIHKKMENDLRWRRCKVIFSGHDVPGEGEHKIMEFVRGRKAQPGYDPNEVHCLYGLDADLIMLGLVVHEPHFILLREDVFTQTYSTGKEKNEPAQDTKPLMKKFHLLHICALREYFLLEFQTLKDKLSFGFDLERIIDDFILMCFFCGNDFLPHMPTLDIHEGAITALFEVYKKVLPTLDGYLTDKGTIHFNRVQPFVNEFAQLEDSILCQRFTSNSKQKSKGGKRKHKKSPQSTQVSPASETQSQASKANHIDSLSSVFDAVSISSKASSFMPQQTLSAQEMKEMIDMQENNLKKDTSGVEGLDAALAMSNVMDFAEPIEGHYGLDDSLLPFQFVGDIIDEPLEEAAQNGDDILMSAVDQESGDFSFELWRKNYYQKKMNIDIHNSEEMDALRLSFVEALIWMYNYYYHQCISWKWYYPYHYTPIASDLINLEELSKKVEFTLGTPFYPFEQLLGVLPPKSSKLLPDPYSELILNLGSDISDFYPEEIIIDREGTKYDWQGVVLLPFIDSDRLLAAVAKIDQSRLTDHERFRNSFGQPSIFKYDTSVSETFTSTLPGDLPDVPNSHVKAEPFTIPAPPNGKFVPALCDGVKMGVNGLEGFPSLFSREIIAEQRTVGVSLYAQPSKAPTVVLHLDVEEYRRNNKSSDEEIQELVPQESERVVDTAAQYKHLLGKTVYVGYPYPRLAYVSSLCDEFTSIYEDSPNHSNSHDQKERDSFRRECGFHRQVLLKKFGIDVGEVDVLLFVRLFKGMGKGKNGSTVKTFYSEEFAYPVQLVPQKYDPVPDPRFVERGTPDIEDEYKVDAQVVCVGDENYGASGKVIGYDKRGPNVKLRVELQVPPSNYQPEYPRDINKYTSSRYYHAGEVSKKVGISPRLIGLLLGSIKVELPDGRLAKHNIGLRLRNTRDNKRIVGYAKLDYNAQNLDETYYLNNQSGLSLDKPTNGLFSTNKTFGWKYSDKAVKLLSGFKAQFPDLIEVLEAKEDSGKMHAAALFPDIEEMNLPFDEAKKQYADRISTISNWVHSNGHLSLPFLTYETDLFPSDVLSDIEAASIDFEAKNKDGLKTISTVIPTPSMIYKAGDPFPTNLCRRDKFSIGQRVITMGYTGHVPFGMRGIIVGIQGEHAMIVFDTEFIGGTTLDGRLKTRRGGVCPLISVLNLDIGPNGKPLRKQPEEKAPKQQQQPQQPQQAQQQNQASKRTNAAKFGNMPYEKHFYSSGQPSSSIEAIKKGHEEQQARKAFTANTAATLDECRDQATQLLQKFQQSSTVNTQPQYNPAQEFQAIHDQNRKNSKFNKGQQQRKPREGKNNKSNEQPAERFPGTGRALNESLPQQPPAMPQQQQPPLPMPQQQQPPMPHPMMFYPGPFPFPQQPMYGGYPPHHGPLMPMGFMPPHQQQPPLPNQPTNNDGSAPPQQPNQQ